MRSAHPDHYRTQIAFPKAEIIENIGEDTLPWHLFALVGPWDASFPTQLDKNYPIGFGLTCRSANGKVIVYAWHEFRDYNNGAQVKLTIVLPKAAPDHLLKGHLNHFSVEFRDWYRAMRARNDA